MAEGIVYLDVDDEITSAASRIRSASGTKVALVVPYGSRIATSRMNFRLLSREALMSNKRLSIVSGDAAARSLAASAGLPVFGAVQEYEASLVAGSGGDARGDPVATESGVEPAPAAAAAIAGAAATPVPAPTGAADASSVSRKSQRPKRPPPDERPIIPPLAAADDHEDDLRGEDRGEDRPRGRSRAPLLAAIGVVGLAVVVLAVAGYLFLPTATIALTPRRDTIGPISLTVSADPLATAVDPTDNVVPAVQVEVPVEAARTFKTTGSRVDETAARGSVVFTNYDTSSGVTIPSGSVVSTEGGIAFRTQSTVILQPAGILPFTPRSDSTNVTAAKTGEAGNVPANTIRVVPQGQNPDLLKVNNPNPTSGGTHTETPVVTKAEVDKAVATLQADLQKAFDAAIADGAGAPADATLFPTTKALGVVTPAVDPKTIVGKEVEEFDLRLTATGTVIAVDPRPVADIARAQLTAQVATDHRLIPDSVVIDVGEGGVGEDGQVTFQATAQAIQVAIVDANALRSLVKGKTPAEAEAALVPFGRATVTLWPAWVSTVTSVDARLTVTVDDTVPGGPSASPSPASSSPSRGRSPGPSTAPSGRGSGGASPVPSAP
ncbi:MAG TPA: baseplate J/gp47 family protein [Candidatus Limnocylindrales bacterium]